MPKAYESYVLGNPDRSSPDWPKDDPNCLATLKNYRSLVPMAQEARKPVFHLTNADGAIGNHAAAVSSAFNDFWTLTDVIRKSIGLITDGC